MELARGAVRDQPWGLTLGAFAQRAITGELAIVDGNTRVALVLEDGKLVGGTSTRAAPSLLERAARTFDLTNATYTLDSQISQLRREPGALDLREVIFTGALRYLDDDRIHQELRQLGTRFSLGGAGAAELPRYGAEAPAAIAVTLRDGASIAELELAHPQFDRRAIQALVYALVTCGAARGLLPSRAPTPPPDTSRTITPSRATPVPAEAQPSRTTTPNAARTTTPNAGRTTTPSRTTTPDASRTATADVGRAPTAGANDSGQVLLARIPTVNVARQPTPPGNRTPTPPGARTTTPDSSRTTTPESSRTTTPGGSRTVTPEGSRTTTPARTTTTRDPVAPPRTSTTRDVPSSFAEITLDGEPGADLEASRTATRREPSPFAHGPATVRSVTSPSEATPAPAPAPAASQTATPPRAKRAPIALPDDYSKPPKKTPSRATPSHGVRIIAPDDEKLYRAALAADRARRLLEAHEYAEAQREALDATRLVPDSFDYQALHAWATFAGSRDKASVADTTRKLLEKASHRADAPHEVRLLLGRLERTVGREREALRHFKAVIEREPGHAEATAQIRELEAQLEAFARR